MKYPNILEEEIKNKVTHDFFQKFDCTKILGKIDFAVKIKHPANSIDFANEYLLWAEVKQKPTDILVMLTQLVLTIGKARTFDEILPPPFLGCYDNEKIAFVPYSEIQGVFYQNDFNWKVTPSDHETREFKQVHAQIEKIVHNDIPWETYLFDFEKDEKELKRFIHENFIVGKTGTTKIRIDKNNFITIYNKWLETVKPTIQVDNWNIAKKNGIIDGDFYLADLLSADNKTLKEKLFVLLKTDHYELDKKLDESGFKIFKTTAFSDNQKAHTQFWAKYERPPLKEYWDYMIERRDLLAPQDVRERKGSFFTPKIWVELSQKYIADVLGEDWQDEYSVWDCAAGTGNLLAGLTNKYHIWASTLDKADVDVMMDRIRNGANLLEDHVFQFDFLNDDFTKLPKGLQDIISNENKRRKLVIYINPPYAEAGTGLGKKHKGGVTVHKIKELYKKQLGKASNEVFAQFLMRIYCEIPTAKIVNFSKLKNLQSSNFLNFRKTFRAKLEKIFLTPAKTFDNVEGQFPIGFFVWDAEKQEQFDHITADVYDEIKNEATFLGNKNLYSYDGEKGKINDWFRQYLDKKNNPIGILHNNKNDFQHNIQVRITSNDIKDHTTPITRNNLIEACIYFAVRKVISADWLNDRDQFLYPNDSWKTDKEFQNDCLAYSLFSNNIQSKYGINHWIPFTEYQVAARDQFDSHFMTDFIEGKSKFDHLVSEPLLFYYDSDGGNAGGAAYKECIKREFSGDAKSVFNAGRELWKYYHAQPKCNVNASLYDIREYFQGRNDKGKMNNKSSDDTYNELINSLRLKLKILAKKIEPKVYEYGFLRE
ncbi:MAG: hypothetical protein FWF52_09015 [Candidatus Azobacteroides sp.]|nr:hypothetical protein [Candidatus Azobacteroides sp.]